MGINTLAKYKLPKEILKKYEPKLGLYFFYNTRMGTFWNTDESLGGVISALDGSLSYEEILNIVSKNNIKVSKEEIDIVLQNAFEFLLKEGYLVE